MAKPVFLLNGNDWTSILNEGSIHWARNDIDTANTGRSKLTGAMYRKRLTMKRKLTIDNVKRLTTAQMAALNAEMNRNSFTCTFLDAITGQPYTATCYNSTVESATEVWDEINNETYWEDVTFSVIEM